MKDMGECVVVLIVCMIVVTILMLGGYGIGRNAMEKEAVKRGFATYDNQNGAVEFSQFKWKDEAQK